MPESLMFSDGALPEIPEVQGDVLYEGWLVHTHHLRPVGAYVLATVRIPATAVTPASSWLKKDG